MMRQQQGQRIKQLKHKKQPERRATEFQMLNITTTICDISHANISQLPQTANIKDA